MFVMEQNYGDKGYVTYYKLLELLGASEGHFLDFNEDKFRLFFAAAIRAESELMYKMISTLAEIGAIDKELWNQNKIIWCQEFVDKLGELYSKRGRNIPVKPDFNTVKRQKSDEPGPETSHSIVKYSKVKNSKVKNEELKLYFSDEKFIEVWNTLREEKKWKDKSKNALQTSLEKIWILSHGNVEEAIQIMKNAIAGGWQGVFPLDESSKKNNYGTKNRNSQTGERLGFQPGGAGAL